MTTTQLASTRILALVDAVTRGDSAVVQELLAGEMSFVPDETRRQLFEIAAKNGHCGLIEPLSMAFRDDQAATWTALQTAISAGQLAFFRMLYDRQPAPITSSYMPSLAVAHGHMDVLFYLADKGADLSDALTKAAELGEMELCRQLMERGARWDEQQEPLRQAAIHNRLDVVKVLLAKGADPQALDYNGWSIAAQCLVSKQPEMAEFLLGQGGSSAMLFLGAAVLGGERYLEWMNRARALGEGPATRDGNDWIALQHAADSGALAAVKELFGMKPKVAVKGKSPLELAAANNHVEVTAYLLEQKGAKAQDVLLAGAEHGHLGLVEMALAKTAKIDARDDSSNTALNLAASHGHVAIVQLLLSKNKPAAAVDSRNIIGHTPLMGAAGAGHLDVVDLLLAHGAALDLRSSQYSAETALYRAVDSGHHAVVRRLIDRGARIQWDTGYQDPVYAAAGRGDVELLELLAQAGSNLAKLDDDHTGAVYRAAREGHTAALSYLLEHHVPSDSKSIGAAAERGRFDLVQLLMQPNVPLPENFVLKAAMGGEPRLLALALEHGGNVNQTEDYSCKTALHFAAEAGHTAAITWLLDHGAVLAARDRDQHTALSLAKGRDRTAAVELLLSRGAKAIYPELVDLAASGDVEGVMRLLGTSHNADPDVLSEGKRTALHEAAAFGYVEVVQTLIEHNAQVDVCDQDGWTPLMDAADCGQLKVVEMLLDRGADPFLKDERGYAAAMLAQKRLDVPEVLKLFESRDAIVDWRDVAFVAAAQGDLATLEALAAKGRDLTLCDSNAQTILHHAARAGRAAVVAWALGHGNRVDVLDRGRQTPLFQVVYGSKDVAACRMLLEAGANPNHVVEYYGDILNVAIGNQASVELVLLLVEHGASLTWQDTDGIHALGRAASSGQQATALALFERGAPSDGVFLAACSAYPELAKALAIKGAAVAYDDTTYEQVDELVAESKSEGFVVRFTDPAAALIQAAGRGSLEVVRALLDNGTSPNPEPPDAPSALEKAESQEHTEIALLLVERGATRLGGLMRLLEQHEPLTAAKISRALQSGDSLELVRADHKTVLHLAAEQGDVDSLRVLIDAGAYLNPKESYGRTPLQRALANNKLDAAKMLLEAGADVNIENGEGWSPAASFLQQKEPDLARAAIARGASTKAMVLAAALTGDPQLIVLAKELGGDPTFVEPSGYTAARYAASSGQRKALDLVLSIGSPVDGALHGAASAGNKQLLSYCLEKLHVAVAARDMLGRTALHEAASQDNKAAVATLLEAGAEVDAIDNAGETPLMAAADFEQAGAAALLIAKKANMALRDKAGKTAKDRIEPWHDEKLLRAFGMEKPKRSWEVD